MSGREHRKRKASEKLHNVDVGVVIEARERRLDALEDDNHAMEQEAKLHEGDEEYEPGQGSEDDEAVFRASAKKKRRSRAKDRTSRRRAVTAGLATVDSNPSITTGTGAASAAPIERWNMSLARMLQEEEGVSRPPGMVAYDDMTAAPSKKPPRPFCAVCGYSAAYTCTRCRSRFCSIRCNNVHEQTQCLKMIANA